ncbi:MAG: hypothetical protein U0905_22345 [Pirellulales bacterium]
MFRKVVLSDLLVLGMTLIQLYHLRVGSRRRQRVWRSLSARGNETIQNPTFSALGLDGPSTFTVKLRTRDSLGRGKPRRYRHN